jgi:hypothetical protein
MKLDDLIEDLMRYQKSGFGQCSVYFNADDGNIKQISHVDHSFDIEVDKSGMAGVVVTLS